jgi:hypothetical protein
MKLILNPVKKLRQINMLICFYKPKTWEEHININNHKQKMLELNKEYIEIIYHPDNIKFFLIDTNIITTYDKYK